ncbi:YhdP family protein [Litoreibacter roseus]|uniref:YhdP central domain-containing protein n=1 Tax=Litoreibacter roseus TaxID=2601869 RepID=A0A6N6JDB5_9RHOB|nr:DUF3971 domain-containing protein [Litoreibacter roseus]GFE64145.1 hypothetical protein KIN_12190 [Litoreibacter roseus]
MAEPDQKSEVKEPGVREDVPPAKPARVRGRKRRGALHLAKALWAGIFGFTVVLLVLVAVAISGRSYPLPSWAVTDIERQLAAQLGEDSVSLESVAVGFRDRGYRPTVDMTGVAVRDIDGTTLLELSKLRTRFDTTELLQGRIALETLDLSEAKLNLSRDENGRLELAFADGLKGASTAGRSISQIIEGIDVLFEGPLLRELETISAEGLTLDLRDGRTGQQIVVENGAFDLTNTETEIAANIRFGVSVADEEITQVALQDPEEEDRTSLVFGVSKIKGRNAVSFKTRFEQVPTIAIAGQVAALSWLGALDAPVSGALTTEVNADGLIDDLAGTLDIGAGQVRPGGEAKPLPLNAAQVYVRYKDEDKRLQLDQITLDAPSLRVSGAGHADLKDFEAGLPQTLLTQLRLDNIRLDPAGIFEAPVRFDTGVVDVRYNPTNFGLEIGQLVLEQSDTRIVARGEISAGAEGWVGGLDATVDQMTAEELVRLWPKTAAPRTRKWLTENILTGDITGAAAALRFQPGQRAASAVTLDFNDATVRYVKTMPPIENATGYISILGTVFDLKVHDGQVRAANGELLDLDASHMQIANLRSKPAIADVDLQITGSADAALSVLDEEPLRILSKAGLPQDVATGTVSAQAKLRIPLKKQEPGDITYEVTADLGAVSSDKLIPGRTIRSDALTLTARPKELEIGGAGTLNGVPINAVWSRGPDSLNTSVVEGTVEISPQTLSALQIDLPPGSVTGQGTGQIRVVLEKDKPPQLKLTSTLEGVGLSIDALGWSKPVRQSGSLEADVTLGATPKVDRIAISGAGLDAVGEVIPAPGGGLDRAVFNSFRIAGRLNSRVEVIGRGRGRPAQLRVRGGTVDIRNFGVGGQGGARRAGPPLDLALDRLVITDAIALDDFRGKFKNDRGIEGDFTAKVNGKAKVAGILVPTANGIAARINAADGGAVLASSGIIRNARGGAMELTLRPNGKPGQFDGSLKIEDTRIKKAPALADLLSALSVVGLLEQLSGDGILFSNVEANFRLSPQGVTLRSSSAVGPSMGISMDGIYNTQTRRMDMRGVISPIYLVNGIIGAMFSPRKGEGLFGFNYTLKGGADSPRVGVNPLSVFTPGIFREIFRQPPPKLSN